MNRFRERRRAGRPDNGAIERCPKCRIGLLEFNERYRLPAAFGRLAPIPAWVCDGADCHYWRPARKVAGSRDETGDAPSRTTPPAARSTPRKRARPKEG